MARPSDIDEDISTIVLGTTRSPGVCTITGLKDAPKWDIKDAEGQVGASTSLKGKPIGSFSCSFYLVDDGSAGESQFDAWESFRRLIKSTVDGSKPVALPISNPDVNAAGYTEVVLGNGGIEGPQYDGRGGATYVVEFMQYRPPKPKPAAKATPKPSGTTQNYSNTDEGPRYPPPKPDPNADAKRELAALTDEASRP